MRFAKELRRRLPTEYEILSDASTIGVNIDNAAASRKLEAALSAKPDVKNFFHTGANLCKFFHR